MMVLKNFGMQQSIMLCMNVLHVKSYYKRFFMQKNLLFLLLLLPVCLLSQQKYNYTNLVLEGGGVRGMAYVGAFSVLNEKGILPNIQKVAGSSVGSIAGLLLCVGYSVREIDSIMYQLPVQQFNDGSEVTAIHRVKKFYGIYIGQKFGLWLQQIVKQKTGNAGLTFMQLHELRLMDKKFRDLYCTGTNLSRQQLKVFSYETTPDVPVALAVRISGSIPIYFEPVALDDHDNLISEKDTTSYRNYFVDGGMLYNYPIGIFDTCENNTSYNPLYCGQTKFNKQTLGIKLEREAQVDYIQKNDLSIPPYNIKKFNTYVEAFTNLLMEAINRRYPNLENELGRTIYISYGDIGSRPRKLKPEEKKWLYDNGVKAAKDFFDKQPIN
jgi:Predicted esterase of the alpha-beta hydrolase superfamily